MRRWVQILGPALLVGSLGALPVGAQSRARLQVINEAWIRYDSLIDATTFAGRTNEVVLVDPRGRILACDGRLLSDYRGFSVGLYEPDSGSPTTTDVRGPVPLTETELPDLPGNGVPGGVVPNARNSNPFLLTNSDPGAYSFLLDPAKGQVDVNRSYIFILEGPQGAGYVQRRIRIVIGARRGDTVAYTATALDGMPINAADGKVIVNSTIPIYGTPVGPHLAVMNLDVSACRAEEMQITKTADRAAAEPGDTVVYRILARNLAEAAMEQVRVTDDLPRGFNFLPRSVRAAIDDRPVAVTLRRDGATVVFETDAPLPPGKALAIVYAVLLTPEALSGTGLNAARVVGVLPPGGGVPISRTISAGPATHQLRIRQGILSDAGTLVGRVFVDRNFDGEQGKGEPGIPNAVVVLDDGTRVTTDANGLFSIQNVLSGYRTAVLDLTASPGYALAPNRRFQERNSPSRLVRLAPGATARVNFAAMLTDEGRPTTDSKARSRLSALGSRLGKRDSVFPTESREQRAKSVVGRWSLVVRLSPENAVEPGDDAE